MLRSNPDVAVMFRVGADLNSLAMCLTSYRLYSGVLPTTEQGLHALTARPTLPPVPAKHRRNLKKVLLDQWGHEYRYRSPARHSDKGYDLWSIGPDGINGSQDDIGNWKAGAR
ncbi:type II secretion system protein GspG [Prosthecobacter sp.]